MRAVVKDVAGRLVDGHRAGLCGLLHGLSAVQGQGCKMLFRLVFRHDLCLLFSLDVV